MENLDELFEQFKKELATAKTYQDLMGKNGAIKKLMKASLKVFLRLR